MARPKRAVVSQRRRWARDRREKSVRAKIHSSLHKTLCTEHFVRFSDDKYFEVLAEVCETISIADEIVDAEIDAFFPSTGMTQELVRAFKEWLKDDDNEPLRAECLPWCRFIIRSLARCAKCRQQAPLLIDSDSDAD